MSIVKGLYYSQNHEWVRVEEGRAYVGITDYAQSSMGDIVYVELPEVDESYEAQDSFAVVESVKAAADVYLPVGGTVVAVNEELEDEPALLNDAPFDQYIAILQDIHEEDLEDLMDAEAYEAYCNGLD